jgi:hypothetical protein
VCKSDSNSCNMNARVCGSMSNMDGRCHSCNCSTMNAVPPKVATAAIHLWQCCHRWADTIATFGHTEWSARLLAGTHELQQLHTQSLTTDC